jgi:transcription-repair coupling factor (superfamily II helicase)
VDKRIDLLEIVASALAPKLRLVADKNAVVRFEHVTAAAQPFLAALLARKARSRVWTICENVRAQEIFYDELLNWLPEARFFPELEVAAGSDALPDPEIAADRLGLLQGLIDDSANQVLVISSRSFADEVPTPHDLTTNAIVLERRGTGDLDAIVKRLDAARYEHVAQVSTRGQFAVRGGILDVFAWNRSLPLRIEFFGDSIESIREFDLDAQTSVRRLESVSVLLGESENQRCPLRDYLRPDDLVIDVAAGFDAARVRISEGVGDGDDVSEDFSGAFYDHGLGEFEAGDLVIAEAKRERLFAQLRQWSASGWSIFIFCNNEGEIERFGDLLAPAKLDSGALQFRTGVLARGFIFPEARVAVLSDAELFGRYKNTRSRRLSLRRAREQARRAQIDFTDLNEGDFVVHLEHGIAIYLGLQKFATGDEEPQEVLALEFADEARLFVPLEQSFLISRYVGVGKKTPPLSAIGDARWSKARRAAEQAVMDYAANLLSLHAERETSRGIAFAPDNKWQREFEASFLYKETPDQLSAIAATKADMETEKPMDRLICGDVGFGKTEVAIRAAFKAVMNGKQVAILVPTTVLAQQHHQTFRERMSDYPVAVEVLSRFRSAAEQRKVIAGMRDGSVDIVIGTHRLISKDVQFKQLGLVVIDEEHRFGVMHKEKFKSHFKLVDVLTLSATPIPRTLYLSLMGAKDMSTIETPPPNRVPTETIICAYDERVMRDAIGRELERQGQVYLLHNRIQTIERLRERVELLCPAARVAIGHGQMDESELEEVMTRFVGGEIDVLVSTTIIESGLDIPNANTIIIDRADRFGLADLYQLRGRVGRAQHKAYAYLMLSREMMATGEARKRINAIKQYSSLGAGFKIAMRDLEIRGAGNILGTAQSGHIVAVGFDLYCQLLKQAIAKLKGEKVQPRLETLLRLDFVVTNEAEFAAGEDSIEKEHAPAFIPTSYIEDAKTRIQVYRQLSEITTSQQLDVIRKNWRDRFGPLPESAENILTLAHLKLVASARKVRIVEVKEDKLMLTRGGDLVLIDGKFPRLRAQTAPAKLAELIALLQSF